MDKNEQIMKPLSVLRNEFISNLTELINSCMLPPFVIEDVLKDTFNKICVISKRQLEEDTRRYHNAMEKMAGDSVNNIGNELITNK